MGFSRERKGKDGKPRYVALYRDLKGRQRSAGTFVTERQADRAWQRAEAAIGLGWIADPARGRQTFRRYVEDGWLPNHEMEATTRQKYTYSLYRHIMPEFGPMRMIDIMPEHVRECVTGLKTAKLSAANIAANKVILSAIFTTALNDQVMFLAPVQGRQDPAGTGQAAHDHHARAVRPALRRAARRLPAAGRDRDREWPALGRAHRAAGARRGVRDAHAYRQPGCGRGASAVPPRWPAVPGQGLPQGPGVPAAQAQRPDHRQAEGPRRLSTALAGMT